MASASANKYWLSPIHEGAGLLRADLANVEFPPHVHDSLVIAVTEGGGAMVKGRGEPFMAHPKVALVFNPGESHSSTQGGQPHWAYRAFYLRGPALERLQQSLETTGCLYFRTNGFPDEELVALLLDCHRALESEGDRCALEEKSAQALGLLYARYGEARPQLPPDTRNRSIVKKVVQQLETRFNEPLCLEELAQSVGLTQFQLIGLFKSCLGMTPYSMLTQIRLIQACGLLIEGRDICEVALATGFYDQSALTKHFKRRYAVTPAQFAHARAGSSAPERLPV